MNSVVLIGRLTSDPKLSYTPNTNTAVNSFRLAVKRIGKDGGTDFIQCKVFGKQAENLDHYKSKGDEIAVHGRIETGSYKNREGNMVYTTEVICDNIEFTHGNKGGRSDDDGDSTQRFTPAQSIVPQQTTFDFDDLPDSFQSAEDDIPF